MEDKIEKVFCDNNDYEKDNKSIQKANKKNINLIRLNKKF